MCNKDKIFLYKDKCICPECCPADFLAYIKSATFITWRNKLKIDSDLEDMTSEIYLAILNEYCKYDKVSKFCSWCLMLVKKRGIDYLRSTKSAVYSSVYNRDKTPSTARVQTELQFLSPVVAKEQPTIKTQLPTTFFVSQFENNPERILKQMCLRRFVQQLYAYEKVMLIEHTGASNYRGGKTWKQIKREFGHLRIVKGRPDSTIRSISKGRYSQIQISLMKLAQDDIVFQMDQYKKIFNGSINYYTVCSLNEVIPSMHHEQLTWWQREKQRRKALA